MSMKDDKTIDKLLKTISYKIIEFEDGDVILISELIDDINNLKYLLTDNIQAKSVLNIALSVLNKLLTRKEIQKPDIILTDSIDLLSKILETSDKADKKLRNFLDAEIDTFLFTYKYLKDEELENKKPDIDKEKIRINELKNNLQNTINTEPFKIFLSEAEEKLTFAQDFILRLENDLNNKEYLNEIFRIFHTIKGECGFLKISTMSELTHHLETLLDNLRNNEIENNSSIIDTLLIGIDYSLNMIKTLKAGNFNLFTKINTIKFNEKIISTIKENKIFIGEILSKSVKLSDKDIKDILEKQKELNYSKKFGEIAIENNLVSENDIYKALNSQKKIHPNKNKKQTKTDPIIKVRASQINFLVDMIGELLIAENQLDDNDKDIIQLKKVTKEIQNATMQLRTEKIKSLLINMKRVVRDTAKELNKNINTILIGDDLEIDRNLIESLNEPLLHIIRNSVGHGIETAEERIKKNKDPEGEIIIKAERKGNNIIISVKDNGIGFDRDEILKKALAKSLISEVDAKILTEKEIFDFIFLPGFSTAKKIDKVSGRGFGMDIVKSCVTSSRGKVELKSKKDEFTEIRLIFPLSMAIIDGMIAEVNDMKIIIPVSNIVESIHIQDEMISTIKNKIKVLNIRQEIIPIVNLAEYFNLNNNHQYNNLIAIIIEINDKKYALIVNKLITKKEIVIKPLSRIFKDLNGISSGTILPGGKIGFILDIDKIISLEKKAV